MWHAGDAEDFCVFAKNLGKELNKENKSDVKNSYGELVYGRNRAEVHSL